VLDVGDHDPRGENRCSHDHHCLYDARTHRKPTRVAISSYKPVDEVRVGHDQEEAPMEIQWSINPTMEVEADLSDVETLAHAAGLEVTTVASQGNPADVLVKHATEQGADGTGACSGGSSAACRTASRTRPNAR
jgi:hypothetical protein